VRTNNKIFHLRNDNVTSENNWIDAIRYPIRRSPVSGYIFLRTLDIGDTIIHALVDEKDLSGIYAGITVKETIDGAPASVDMKLDNDENKCVNIPARVVNVGGCRHIIALSSSVKIFEVLGSLSQKIAEMRRIEGQNRLIERYAR